MHLVQFYAKERFDKGNIETLAVVGDQDLVFLNILLEFIKILSLDIGENGFTVIESNRSYLIKAKLESRGFDVQISGRFSEFRKESPEMVGGQEIPEIIGIPSG